MAPGARRRDGSFFLQPGTPSPRRLGPEKRGGEKPTSCPADMGEREWLLARA